MFTVIAPYTVKKRPKKKVFSLFKEYKDIKYFELPIPVFSGEINWNGLSFFGGLLLPKNINAPNHLNPLGGNDWKTKLAFELLKEIFKKEKCDCVIYDKNGTNSDKISELLPISKNVSVFTDNWNIYEKRSLSLMKNFGCEPLINTLAGTKKGYCFSFDNEPLNPPENFKIISKNCIKEEMIKIPSEYAGISIKNLDRIAYSDALCTCFKKGNPKDYLRF